jgi:hypothetical protein
MLLFALTAQCDVTVQAFTDSSRLFGLLLLIRLAQLAVGIRYGNVLGCCADGLEDLHLRIGLSCLLPLDLLVKLNQLLLFFALHFLETLQEKRGSQFKVFVRLELQIAVENSLFLANGA